MGGIYFCYKESVHQFIGKAVYSNLNKLLFVTYVGKVPTIWQYTYCYFHSGKKKEGTWSVYAYLPSTLGKKLCEGVSYD